MCMLVNIDFCFCVYSILYSIFYIELLRLAINRLVELPRLAINRLVELTRFAINRFVELPDWRSIDLLDFHDFRSTDLLNCHDYPTADLSIDGKRTSFTEPLTCSLLHCCVITIELCTYVLCFLHILTWKKKKK